LCHYSVRGACWHLGFYDSFWYPVRVISPATGVENEGWIWSSEQARSYLTPMDSYLQGCAKDHENTSTYLLGLMIWNTGFVESLHLLNKTHLNGLPFRLGVVRIITEQMLSIVEVQLWVTLSIDTNITLKLLLLCSEYILKVCRFARF
jgi:hypothetical protein